jgi:hypothetical protein
MGLILLLPQKLSNWQSQNPQSTTLILQTTQRGRRGGGSGKRMEESSQNVCQPVPLVKTY